MHKAKSFCHVERTGHGRAHVAEEPAGDAHSEVSRFGTTCPVPPVHEGALEGLNLKTVLQRPCASHASLCTDLCSTSFLRKPVEMRAQGALGCRAHASLPAVGAAGWRTMRTLEAPPPTRPGVKGKIAEQQSEPCAWM